MAAPFQQGRTAYQDFQTDLSPTALRGPVGAAFEAGLAALKDNALDVLAQSVKARMPGVAPGDALGAIGADRSIVRGASETDASYGGRLRGAWEAWPWGGTARGLLRALNDAGYPNTAVVQHNGTMYVLDPGTTNLVTYSDQLLQNWGTVSLTGSSVPTAIGPDGKLSARTWFTASPAGVLFHSAGFTIATTGFYTFSALVTALGGLTTLTGFVEFFVDGAVITSTSVNATYKVTITPDRGWRRFSTTARFTAGQTVQPAVSMSSTGTTNTWGIYGAQFEAHDFPSRYTPNQGSALPRAADPDTLIIQSSPPFFFDTTSFWSRFAVVFFPPFPASWAGTPPVQASDEVSRIRRLVSLWKPAHATCVAIVASPGGQLWDYPNPAVRQWDTWRDTWDQDATPNPTIWTP